MYILYIILGIWVLLIYYNGEFVVLWCSFNYKSDIVYIYFGFCGVVGSFIVFFLEFVLDWVFCLMLLVYCVYWLYGLCNVVGFYSLWLVLVEVVFV